MAREQTNTNKYLAQAATRVAIQAKSMTSAARAENIGHRMPGPIMKQPTFDWSAKDKYVKLRNFKLEVKNMLQNFNISQNRKSINYKKTWPSRQDLQLLETLMQVE